MPSHEVTSSEGLLGERIEKAIAATVDNVAARVDLPPTVLSVIYDDQTGERFMAFVGVAVRRDERGKLITVSILEGIHQLAGEANLTDILDVPLENVGELTLACDRKIAEKLPQGSFTWVNEGRYGLLIRPRAIVEVYIDDLPPGVRETIF